MLVLLLAGRKPKINVWGNEEDNYTKIQRAYCFSIFNLVPNFVVARLTQKGGWCLSGIDNQENKPEVICRVFAMVPDNSYKVT